MDKDYKRLGKEAKKIEKDTEKVLTADKKRDKLVKAGKKAMKEASANGQTNDNHDGIHHFFSDRDCRCRPFFPHAIK